MIGIHADLPPLVQKATRLRLFTIRNVQKTVPVDQLDHIIRKNQLSLRNPAMFEEGLAKLEDQVGTGFATLAGLLVASGIKTKELSSHFDRFTWLVKRTERFFGGPAPTLEVLDHLLNPRLALALKQNDFSLGLQRLKIGLSRQRRFPNPGSCVVNAALFGLFGLAHGFMVGEMHELEDFHNAAFFQWNQLLFDVPHQCVQRLFPATRRERQVYSGAFSFIASLLLNQAMVSLEDKQLTRRDLLSALNKLECAEAINPYYVRIYRKKAEINDRLGRFKAAALNRDQAKEMLDLFRAGNAAEYVF
jgi:hypothetical protein